MTRRLILLLLLLFAAVVTGALWIHRNLPAQAERLILSELTRRGFPDASLHVIALGTRHAEVEAIRLGSDDELRVARVSAHYTVEGLWQRRVDAIRISGVEVRLGIGRDGLGLGSLDPLLAFAPEAPADAGAETRAPTPELGELVIEDFKVTVDVMGGAVVAAGKLELREGRLRLDARTEPLTLEIQGSSFEVRPVEMEMTASPFENPIPFEVTLRDPEVGLMGRGTGRHDTNTQTGEFSFAFDAVRFDPDGLQPVTLLPLLAPWIQVADGTLEAQGDLRWKPGEFHNRVRVACRDLNVTSVAAKLGLLNGAVTLDGTWPLSTTAGQVVSMASVDFGLQLTNGMITYQLHEDGSVEIERARWDFAGGRIATEGRLVPGEDFDLLLRATDVDLGELLKLIPVDGLSGEGKMSGQIPVSLRGSDVLIEDGRLSGSAEGGWLRYQPNADVGIMGGGDDHFAIALDAIENLRWTTLEIALSGNTRDETVVTLHIAGANPDYRNGHPVEFNFKIEAQLADLLRKSSASYRIPEQIEKHLAEFATQRE
jgi:hypothetical protein